MCFTAIEGERRVSVCVIPSEGAVVEELAIADCCGVGSGDGDGAGGEDGSLAAAGEDADVVDAGEDDGVDASGASRRCRRLPIGGTLLGFQWVFVGTANLGVRAPRPPPLYLWRCATGAHQP